MTKLVERNTTLPVAKAQDFTTFRDGQTAMAIHVVQGERDRVEDCRSLARFELRGIPPMPAGLPRIEVRFQIDANGILHVSAKDRATGKEQSIRIEASSGLSEDDIQKMVREAESHSAEDRKRKEAVESRNRADTLAYETERNLKEHGDKLDPALKAKVEEGIARLREALKGEDAAMLDVMSGGRFVLGIAIGYKPDEFALYGAELEKRGARFEEQLAIMKALWTQDSVSFQGAYYNVTGRLEPDLADAAPGAHFQFERNGYFVADTVSSRPGKPVFNRTVTLRDSWAKIEQEALAAAEKASDADQIGASATFL